MMSDSEPEDAGLDNGHGIHEVVSPCSGNSLINMISSRTQRLGVGASLVFRQNDGQPEKSSVAENHDEISQTNEQLQDQSPMLLPTTPDGGTVVEGNHVNHRGPVRLQTSNSTSGYSSAQDLTPESNAAEERAEPPIPHVLKECVSLNSLPSDCSRSSELQASSLELPSSPLSMPPQQPRLHQQQSRVEEASGPSVSSFLSSDTANYPCDTESITVSQESTDPLEDTVDKIRRHSLCDTHGCVDNDCQAGRLKTEAMKIFLDASADPSTTNRGFFFDTALESLKAIQAHSEDCDEPKCKIPLCYFYKQKDYSTCPWKVQVQHIREEYFSGNPILMLPGSSFYKKLTHTSTRTPVESADFNNLTRIGDFGNCVIALSGEERSEHWWIKRSYMVVRERIEHTTAVMEAICSSPNPNILPQLWYIKQEDHLYYATPYIGTLAQKLTKLKGQGFLEEACLMVMQQMVNAVAFLHSKNVLYLNWQCKNIAYDEAKGLAKITNFTNAVQLPVRDTEEEVDVMATLQEWMCARLVPPEIYKMDHLGIKNDIWGIASLLYEMSTGSVIHEQYRHEEPSTVRELLTDNPVVNLDKVQSSAIKKLLRKSLKVSWNNRLTLEDFRTNVIQNLSEYQQQHSS